MVMSSIDLLALTAQSGLPLFSRRVANVPPPSTAEQSEEAEHISLNTIATLYGLNLFTRLNGAQLERAESADGQVAIRWRCFAGSDEAKGANLVLIMVAKNVDVDMFDLGELLLVVFKMILMLCGREEVCASNVERLKGSLRLAHSAIDYLLHAAISDNLAALEQGTRSVTYAFTSRSTFICSIVNTIAASVGTDYCVLFAYGRLLSASKGWWSKFSATDDCFRLVCLVNSIADTELIHTKEMPVYLASFEAGRRPLRLIVSKVTRELKLCLLLPATVEASLERIETEVIVPLNDTKLQEEKLAKYIFGSRTSSEIPTSILASIFGSNLAILDKVSGFVFWHLAQRLHFIYNEPKVEENVDLLLVLAKGDDLSAQDELTNTRKIKYFDTHIQSGSLSLYQVVSDWYRLVAIFDCPAATTSISVESMCTTTAELAQAIVKAKHFWR